MFFRGYSVEDVIKFIKEKRPVAYLSREVLAKAYSTYSRKLNQKKEEEEQQKVIVSSVKKETNGNGVVKEVEKVSAIYGDTPTQSCMSPLTATKVNNIANVEN